jgi:hypothetical protein
MSELIIDKITTRDGSNVGAVVVADIDELLLLNTNKEINTTAIVKDSNRGGVFNYDGAQSGVNNGGTIFNGWVRQYDGAVNVKWFGASEIRLDNEVPIQAAIDNTKGKVILPTGIFKTSGTIRIDRPIDFYGVATGTVGAGSTIITDNSSMIYYSGDGVAVAIVSDIVDSLEGVSLSNFSIKGTSSGRVGLLVGDYSDMSLTGKNLAVTKAKIKNIQVTNFTGVEGAGIRLSHVFETTITNLYSKFNTFGLLVGYSIDSLAMTGVSDDATTTRFDGCTFRENTQGIFLGGKSMAIQFVNCVIESNFGYGARLYGKLTQHCAFHNVWFENNNRDTVTNPDGYSVILDANLVNDGGEGSHFTYFTNCAINDNGIINIVYGDRVFITNCGGNVSVNKATTAQAVFLSTGESTTTSSSMPLNDVKNPTLVNTGSVPLRKYEKVYNNASVTILATSGLLTIQDILNKKTATFILNNGERKATLVSQTDISEITHHHSLPPTASLTFPKDEFKLKVFDQTNNFLCVFVCYNDGLAPKILQTDGVIGTNFSVGTASSGGAGIHLYYQSAGNQYVLENKTGNTVSIEVDKEFLKPHFGTQSEASKVNVILSGSVYSLQNTSGATAEFVYGVLNPDGY